MKTPYQHNEFKNLEQVGSVFFLFRRFPGEHVPDRALYLSNAGGEEHF